MQALRILVWFLPLGTVLTLEVRHCSFAGSNRSEGEMHRLQTESGDTNFRFESMDKTEGQCNGAGQSGSNLSRPVVNERMAGEAERDQVRFGIIA